MSSIARVLSTKLIGVLHTGKRAVKVGYVDKTDRWDRVFLSQDMQQKFSKTAEKNLSSLREDTDMVALQETPHDSDSEKRTHFTAVEIDDKGTVRAKRHFSYE